MAIPGPYQLNAVAETKVMDLLSAVPDPEVPVLSVTDLGIIRKVAVSGDAVEVTITPTYTGCPAMDAIAFDIKMMLLSHGYKHVKILSVLSPAWTTDWMTEAGKEKLKSYGIAPPKRGMAGLTGEDAPVVECPQCGSAETLLLSQFGSTACKALYQCTVCKEPFDYFKCY